METTIFWTVIGTGAVITGVLLTVANAVEPSESTARFNDMGTRFDNLRNHMDKRLDDQNKLIAGRFERPTTEGSTTPTDTSRAWPPKCASPPAEHAPPGKALDAPRPQQESLPPIPRTQPVPQGLPARGDEPRSVCWLAEEIT